MFVSESLLIKGTKCECNCITFNIVIDCCQQYVCAPILVSSKALTDIILFVHNQPPAYIGNVIGFNLQSSKYNHSFKVEITNAISLGSLTVCYIGLLK